MRRLFVIDKKNYDKNNKVFNRPSARSIIIKDNKIALVHSALYDYYKFPGGGINEDETPENACIRETKEETGLIIKNNSLKPYGSVLRKEKGDNSDIFIQENYYYFAEIEDEINTQSLDSYESKEGFTLEWVSPEIAIEVNSRKDNAHKSDAMIEREKMVLELLIKEGYFKKYKYDLRNLLLFIPFFITDLIFHLITVKSLEIGSLLRMFFFDLGVSSLISVILSFFNSKKLYFIIGLLINIILSSFAFAQLEFQHLILSYYSLTGAAGGEGAVKEFIFVFIADALPEYWLCFVSVIVFIIIYRFYLTIRNNKYYVHSFIPVICALMLFSIFNFGVKSIDLKDIYYYHSNYEAIINNLGINHFLFKDLSSVIIKPKEKEIVIIPEPEDEKKTETISYIDDTKWKEAIDKETDQTIKQIDEYLINRPQEEKNEYTGILKDKNFIYIMVESFDYLTIDEDLTPTLYTMYSKGMSFINHYTPMYICATGDSELVGMNSYIPYNDACTIHFDQDNDYATSLAYLFKNAGYNTYAYHNWIDEFYDRHTLNASEGFDSYKDFKDLNMREVQGWQSDSDLFKLAYDEFSKSDRYFAFLVSSTMHFTYTEPSYFGDKNLEIVQQKYPEMDIDFQRYLSKCIEFDKALEVLINNLKADGELENTTICLFGDHRPYMLKDDRIIANCSLIDRSGSYGANLGPFIIYDSTLGTKVINNVCSTLDQAPTIANLFGLNYDSRLYMGSDIFNNNCIVIFRNTDWITNEGIYYHLSGSFYNFDSEQLSKEEILRINNKVTTLYSISRSILKNDYFRIRHFITNPTIKEEIIEIEE